jgi:hypothetical protein
MLQERNGNHMLQKVWQQQTNATGEGDKEHKHN